MSVPQDQGRLPGLDPPARLIGGDCLAVLRTLPDNSVDAIVTDPPYGLSAHPPAEVAACLRAWLDGKPYVPRYNGFMNSSWDAWVPGPEVWREALRVLKPGGHCLAFAGTRSMDLMGLALRLAGFELRDSLGHAHDGAPVRAWVHGQGFPHGIDVGLIDFAVTSTGSHFANPRHLKQAEKNLKRKQQKLSRKVKGSKGRDKARQLVARVHERVKNTRQDFVHKVSTRLVNENQVIAVEDLNVKGLLRNHSLAKAIADVGWGMFTQFLTYKTARAGKGLIKVNRFYPSSKACNTCGCVREKLDLSVRFWTCGHCGARHDRDENAARNIRDEAHRMIWAGILPASAPGTGAAAAGGNVSRGRGRKSSVTQIPMKAETGMVICQ